MEAKMVDKVLAHLVDKNFGFLVNNWYTLTEKEKCEISIFIASLPEQDYRLYIAGTTLHNEYIAADIMGIIKENHMRPEDEEFPMEENEQENPIDPQNLNFYNVLDFFIKIINDIDVYEEIVSRLDLLADRFPVDFLPIVKKAIASKSLIQQEMMDRMSELSFKKVNILGNYLKTLRTNGIKDEELQKILLIEFSKNLDKGFFP